MTINKQDVKQAKISCHIAELATDASIDRVWAINREYEIILWNKKNEELTGIRKHDAIGKKIADILPGIEQLPDIEKGIAAALSGMNYFVPSNNGSYDGGYYENHFTPLKEQDEVVGVLNIGHDVSHRIKAENELKALNKSLAVKNRQLEQRNNELSSISYITSHDLKEPLRKIFTFIDLLNTQKLAEISESGMSYFKRIQSAAQRLRLLTDDIQVYAQISINDSRFEKVDLNEVLAGAVQRLKKIVQEKKAVITSARLPVVNGEKQLLVQLFEVLLSNALKFQEPGNVPHIEITTRTAAPGEMDHPDMLPETSYSQIIFADNGIGFNNEYNAKIYQIFQRLHNMSDFPGTGIGLAIAKKIIELHHGFITAESDHMKGSRFHCFFPM